MEVACQFSKPASLAHGLDGSGGISTQKMSACQCHVDNAAHTRVTLRQNFQSQRQSIEQQAARIAELVGSSRELASKLQVESAARGESPPSATAPAGELNVLRQAPVPFVYVVRIIQCPAPPLTRPNAHYIANRIHKDHAISILPRSGRVTYRCNSLFHIMVAQDDIDLHPR